MEEKLDRLALELYRNEKRMNKERFFSIRKKIEELRKMSPDNDVFGYRAKLERIESDFVIIRPKIVINETPLEIKRYFLGDVPAGIRNFIFSVNSRLTNQEKREEIKETLKKKGSMGLEKIRLDELLNEILP